MIEIWLSFENRKIFENAGVSVTKLLDPLGTTPKGELVNPTLFIQCLYKYWLSISLSFWHLHLLKQFVVCFWMT